MQKLGESKKFPTGENQGVEPHLDDFVALLPEIYYAVNRVLEDSTGALFSKKVGVALWAIAGSAKRDEVGKYLTVGDLVATFRDWFVVSDKGASSVVSKVKKDMFDLQYIMIAGGPDRVHLTEKGEAAANQMMTSARRVIENTLGPLQPEERAVLLDCVRRMLFSGRKRAPATEPLW